MKNKFKKENLMPIIVLGSICIIVAGLMGAVNMLTGPIIQKAEEQKVYDSLREVLDGEFAPAELPEDAPKTVTAIYKVTEDGELIGHVVTVEKQGYASKILLTVGIDSEGKTTKVVITSQQETHGKDINPLLDGLSAGITSDEVRDVEHVANATRTSEFIKEAVADAFKAVGFSDGSSDDSSDGDEGEETDTLPKTDEEIKAVAAEMLEGVTLTDIALENAPSALKRAYSAGYDGYFLYIVVPGDYVPVATEAMVQLDGDCKIVKVNLLSWIVGHGVGAGNFADGFVGANKDTAGEVELVTGATGTSVDFRDAVEESLVYFAENHAVEELPKTDDEIKAIADGMVDGDITLTNISFENAPAALKRVYDAGDNGYFFYIVIPGAYVPVATEAVVHIDNSGEIVKVNLLSWIVGHGVEPGNFADGFAGANKDTAGEVELVTGATGTSVDFRNAVEESLAYFVENYGIKEELPKTDDEIKAIAAAMAGKELELSDFVVANAPDTLKRVYSAGADGYFLYIVVPGDYVPVATEAVVHLNADCEIVKVNLLSWIVGHGVEPGNFADGFAGANKDTAGDVELVTEATGTSSDFRDAVEAAIITVADGDAAKENLLIKKMEALVPNAKRFEKLSLPEGASETLKSLYKVIGFDGYVAYVITSTKYVDVETEALVYINSKGEVGNIELITWTVGHGIEPGDFAQSLIGKNAGELAEVELVTAATVTAGNLRDAVADAINCIPRNNTPIIVGVVALAFSAVAVTLFIIVKRRKRA